MAERVAKDRVPEADEALRRAFAAGEPAAMEALVERHFDEVARFCQSLLGDAEAACEAAQDSFLTLLERHHRYDPARPWRPWMFGVAHRICLRREHKGRQAAARVIPIEELEAETEAALRVESSTVEDILRRQTREAILAALDALRPDRRAVILLRFMHDLTFREIAEALGRPLSSVTTSYYRGLAELSRSAALREIAGKEGATDE